MLQKAKRKADRVAMKAEARRRRKEQRAILRASEREERQRVEDRRREQREIDVERWATARLRLSESIRHMVAYDAMQSMLLGRTIRHAIAFTDWEGEGMGPWDSVYAHIDERGEWFVLKAFYLARNVQNAHPRVLREGETGLVVMTTGTEWRLQERLDPDEPDPDDDNCIVRGGSFWVQ